METPSLKDVIDTAIQEALVNVHTALPAKVINVSASYERCDIQPLLKRKFSDGTLVDLPVINNVPILYPRSKDFSFTYPIEIGDTGLALFAERSLDLWLIAGGAVDPKDTRKFNLSDAIFLPGLYPFNAAPEASSDKIILKFKNSKVTISNSGKFTFFNGQYELISLIDELITALLNARVNTVYGPQPLIPPTLFTTIQAKLATMKE